MCKKFSLVLSVLVVVALMSGGAQAALRHQWHFQYGTTNDYIGGAHGTLVGGAAVVGGALLTTAQDQWMYIDGAKIGINTFPAVTLECWYHPEAGANTSWSMLAYLGATDPGAAWKGIDYIFITSARNDDKSRAAISTGGYDAPWSQETGADGPEYDDDALHHMVGVFTDTEVALYIDGVLAISPADPNPNTDMKGNLIANLSNNDAYLAKGGYGDDPEWIGQILEFNIYDNALSDNEVAANFAKGPVPEPATIALLGLGALALIKRRR